MDPHHAHHYGRLIARWRAVAKSMGTRLRIVARTESGEAIYCLKTPALEATGGIYISAGIHGDEAASTEGLIAWAEKHRRKLPRWPLLLFPCINPWGLRGNIRLDEEGLDLNRSFHIPAHPVIDGLKAAMQPYQFELALMLHEDYDAQGYYLYELQRTTPYWGEQLLTAAARQIPVDPRGRIEGMSALAGLIRRRYDRKRFAKIGCPEAIWLHEFHARRTFTVEAPSEFALDQRVRAHVEVLEECLRLVGY
jgi:protein MpaA